MENKSDNKNPIQVADRLFAVLELLAKEGPLALNDLTQKLGLNKSTVHRLLSSFIHMGYVRQDEDSQKYDLTFKILAVSNQFLDRIDILETVKPLLKKLSQETGETVHFVQLDGTDAVYIHKEESSQNAVRMVSRVGSRIPVYCSGVGKAMAADMTTEQIRQLWEQSDIRPFTKNTITDYDTFCSRLMEIRKKGYALDDEENELGVRCIAVSIADYEGKPGYAVSISAPVSRMPDERIEELAGILSDMKKELAF